MKMMMTMMTMMTMVTYYYTFCINYTYEVNKYKYTNKNVYDTSSSLSSTGFRNMTTLLAVKEAFVPMQLVKISLISPLACAAPFKARHLAAALIQEHFIKLKVFLLL